MIDTQKKTLVVDTNLFFECKTLPELPWSTLNADPIELVVTRPVQTEVDRHKKNSKGRTYRRALATVVLFRSLLTGEARDYPIEDSKLIIRSGSPRVTLRLDPMARPDPAVLKHIDPNLPDDLIVAIARGLANQGEDEVFLLTHDTGPMATAKALGVPYIAIPDAWLLGAQNDAKDLEIRKLKETVSRLESAEPHIKLSLEDAAGEPLERLVIEETYYEPLDEREVVRLLGILEASHPVATDFGSAETTPKPQSFEMRTGVFTETFVPASKEEIEAYTSKAYPQWLARCRDLLENLHKRVNAQRKAPIVNFTIANIGTRPADDLLIAFETKGDILIQETPDTDDEESPEASLDAMILPPPPVPPQGKWVISSGGRLHPSIVSIDTLRAMGIEAAKNPFFKQMGIGGLSAGSTGHSSLAHLLSPPKHDPNALYWKPTRPSSWTEAVKLTCDQFRHDNERSLNFEVMVLTSEPKAKGALQCKVQASNLTDTVKALLPIDYRRATASVLEFANELVQSRFSDPGHG